MTKAPAQLEAEIAEVLRAKKWQEQIAREDRERRARIAGTTGTTGPSPEQLYEEYQSDLAAGVFHGERRGRAKDFRKAASAAEALRASEAAKRATDDALLAPEQTAAANAHRRAARLHRTDPAGAETAWLHERAVTNHQLAAKARASRALTSPDPTQTKRRFAAYQAQLSAASEHGAMAKEYAAQALAAARKRS
jgi:hypothetical protein